MAQGQSNAGIAKTLWITHGAVEKHIKHILAKLGIPATSDTHRRVLAAITFLETRYPALGRLNGRPCLHLTSRRGWPRCARVLRPP